MRVEEAQAMEVLTSWNGTNGWNVEVTIAVSDVADNHAQAKLAVLAALDTLGIHARESYR